MQNKTLKRLTVTQIETMNKHELAHIYKQIMHTNNDETTVKIPRSQTSIKRIICYKLQEIRHGKLKPKYQTMIDKYCANPDMLTGKKYAITYNIAVGQILTKQYKGTTHTAVKTPEGFTHNGKTYSSLSAIANYITGQKVSGFRFFNLRHRSDKNRTTK